MFGDSHWPCACFCAHVVTLVSKVSPFLPSELAGRKVCGKRRSPAAPCSSHFRGTKRLLGSFALHGSTLQETTVPYGWCWPTCAHFPLLEGVALCPIPNKGPAPMTRAGVPAWDDGEALCGHLLFFLQRLFFVE